MGNSIRIVLKRLEKCDAIQLSKELGWDQHLTYCILSVLLALGRVKTNLDNYSDSVFLEYSWID